jgi:DNA-directed RNA polymerase sigma subunit (sigma70/sigma32)
MNNTSTCFLKEGLTTLSAQEQDVLNMRFGLTDGYGHSPRWGVLRAGCL